MQLHTAEPTQTEKNTLTDADTKACADKGEAWLAFARANIGPGHVSLRLDNLPVVRIAAARTGAPKPELAGLEVAHERRQQLGHVVTHPASPQHPVKRQPAHAAHACDHRQRHTLFLAARRRGDQAFAWRQACTSSSASAVTTEFCRTAAEVGGCGSRGMVRKHLKNQRNLQAVVLADPPPIAFFRRYRPGYTGRRGYGHATENRRLIIRQGQACR
jgi:hypothetical protein